MPRSYLYCWTCGERLPALPEARPDAFVCAACGDPLHEEAPARPVRRRKDPLRGRVVADVAVGPLLSASLGRRVYQGTHRGLRTQVRLCLYAPDAAEREPERMRLALGRAAVARGAHSLRLASVLDLGRVAEGCFVVTDPVRGTLADRLARHGRLGTAEALRLLADCLEGLAALSEVGGVHGDLRPETVLIALDGSARLDHPGAPLMAELDGLALDPDGRVTGPALYLAPERARDEGEADIRSDLYALGVIAHEMLTGRPPVIGASAREAVQARLDGPLPSVREARPDVPAPVARFVACLTARDPLDRPQSATAALEEMRALAAEPSVAGGTVRLAPARPPAVRATFWTVLGVLLVAASVAPLVLVSRGRAREQEAPAPGQTVRLLVGPAEQSATPLSDAEAAALDAMLHYRLSFYPALALAPDTSPAQGAAADSDVPLLVVAYGTGLDRHAWQVSFADLKERRYVSERVPVTGEGEWPDLERTFAGVLHQAAGSMGLDAGPEAPAAVGASPEAWAALGAALAAEREGRWADALAAVEPHERLGGPFGVLAALYRSVISAQGGGRLAPPGPVAADLACSPEMAGLAAVLSALAAGNPQGVLDALGDHLARFPKSARGYYLLGLWRLYGEGSRETALVAWRHAAKLDPGYAPAELALGDGSLFMPPVQTDLPASGRPPAAAPLNREPSPS